MGRTSLFFGFIIFCCIQNFNAEASEKNSESPSGALMISIRDAVGFTLKNNTTIKVAEAKVAEAVARRSGVWGSLLPDVSFEYDWKRAKDAVAGSAPLFEGDSYNTYGANLVFAQPILLGGALWSGPAMERAKAEAAKLDEEIVRRNQLQLMAKAYYSLLLYQEQVATLKRQFETQTKLIRQARQRYRMGAERQLTVLQFETQSALLRPRIIEAENNAQLAAIELLNFLGKSDVSSIQVRGALDAVLAYRPVAAAQVSLDSLAEVKMLEYRGDALEASKAVTMAEHWPSLHLTGRWGQRSLTKSEMFSPDTRAWSYGLQLKVPLFSGLSSFSKRRELAAQSAQLHFEEQSVRDSRAITLMQTEKTLRTSDELIKAKKIAFDLARRSYQEASKMFGFGTLMYRDYFDIEKDLVEAELSYYSSLYEHIVAAMNFHVATGQDLGGFFGMMSPATI